MSNMLISKYKLSLILIAVSLILTGCFHSNNIGTEESSNKSSNKSFNKNTMELTSPDFEDGGNIPSKFTCDGKDINPRLEISNVPDRAASLALIVEDPDAPGGTFTHWTVWNINPELQAIEENSVPEGARQGMTDFGSKGYGGPCPPSGTHRYFFKLYALEEKINLDPGADKSDLETAIKERVVDSAELMGNYSKQ